MIKNNLGDSILIHLGFFPYSCLSHHPPLWTVMCECFVCWSPCSWTAVAWLWSVASWERLMACTPCPSWQQRWVSGAKLTTSPLPMCRCSYQCWFQWAGEPPKNERVSTALCEPILYIQLWVGPCLHAEAKGHKRGRTCFVHFATQTKRLQHLCTARTYTQTAITSKTTNTHICDMNWYI